MKNIIKKDKKPKKDKPLKKSNVIDIASSLANIKKKDSSDILILAPSELDYKPKKLSGGQRQRVALGRALVRRPKVLLMDEPLSNLDAELRHQMRNEIRRLHDELGTTTIYVTHDQIEAMTLADRVAILDKGVLQQHAPPLEAYNNPSNDFVKSFLCKHIDDLVDTANSLFSKD